MRRRGLRSSIMYLCLGISLFLTSGSVAYAKPNTAFKNAKYKDVVEKTKQAPCPADAYLALPGVNQPVNSFVVNKFSDMEGHVDSKVYTAFEFLQFSYIVDPGLTTTGVFSVGNHWIKVQKPNGYYVLHELGHFLSALEKNADRTTAWTAVYNAEKSKYRGTTKAYVTSTPAEYFAESFRDYSENPVALKKARPRTYDYIHKVVTGINLDKDMKWFYIMYGGYWPIAIDFN